MKKLYLAIIIAILAIFSTGVFAEDMDLMKIFPKIVGIGDSLMSGEHERVIDGKKRFVDMHEYSWLSYICRKTGATPVHYSKGGRTCRTWIEDYKAQFIEDKCKAPCFFIALGTNDLAEQHHVEIGNFSDEAGKDTYIGKYKEIIQTIRSLNQDSVIFLCSLYYTHGEKYDNMNNVIKYLADQDKRCYYLDICALPNNLRDTKFNAGHYSTIGYYAIAMDIYDAANKILNQHIDDLNMLAIDIYLSNEKLDK